MKRLIISNDCDGGTVDTMCEAQDAFGSYAIPFSESCWIFAQNGVSLLDYDTEVKPSKDYMLLSQMIRNKQIDTLHTWGDFPNGGFSRDLAIKGFKHIEHLKFPVWTAHGGYNDSQNMRPLGEGDVVESSLYHLDITQKLGVKYFNLNTDIDVHQLPTNPVRGNRLRRFRGLSKKEAYSININYLPEQIGMIDNIEQFGDIDLVILYTHLYATEEPNSVERWKAVDKFKFSDRVDKCLRDLLCREGFEFTTFNEVLK